MSKTSSNSSGIKFLQLLTIAFVVLKLCGVIDWSWWWVITPMFVHAGILLLGELSSFLTKLGEAKK